MPLRQKPAAAALWRREKMEHVGSRLSMTEGARRGAIPGAALGGAVGLQTSGGPVGGAAQGR